MGIALLVKIVLFVIYFALFGFLSEIGKLLLKPVEFSEVLKLITVIIIVPLLVNILTFFVFDHLIKKKETHDKELDLVYFDIQENLDQKFNFEELKKNLLF